MKDSRDNILKRLKSTESKPLKELEYQINNQIFKDRVSEFISNLKKAGGDIIYDLTEYDFLDTRKKIDKNIDSPKTILIEGVLGVAENGAVWIEPKDRYPRSWITLAETLIITLDSSNIVDTMLNAYMNLNLTSNSYALFISGPSKTADIEQSLVLGAHGAINTFIYLKE